MNRIKNFLLCLVLLALVGIVHHLWLGMSGASGIVTTASAATLSNGSAQTCNGTGTWHFVNPHANGVCQPLTVVFSCDGTLVDTPATIIQSYTNKTNYNTIQTSGTTILMSVFN